MWWMLERGGLAPEKVLSCVADWNDAPQALLERSTKFVASPGAPLRVTCRGQGGESGPGAFLPRGSKHGAPLNRRRRPGPRK